MAPKPIPAVERFWPKVNKDTSTDCWLWTRATDHGYGTFWDGTRVIRAHVFSYTLVHGDVPDGKIICHHCDVRACVNPEHLYAGTYSTNANDRVRRNRSAPRQKRPVKNGREIAVTKLTEDQVIEMRRRRAEGETYKSLGIIYGVSTTTAYFAVTGRNWGHLK